MPTVSQSMRLVRLMPVWLPTSGRPPLALVAALSACSLPLRLRATPTPVVAAVVGVRVHRVTHPMVRIDRIPLAALGEECTVVEL